jgi:hypothetical protein
MVPPKKESQFAAATARLGQQANMNMKKAPITSPAKKPTTKQPTFNGHHSVGNLGRSSTAGIMTGGVSSNNKKLAPPPFVSPGAGVSKKPVNFSYLDKPTGTKTPTNSSKSKFPSSPGFGGLAFSPSPSSTTKPKLSFQAQSPTVKIANKPKVPASTYYGGSYLNKGNDNRHAKASSAAKATEPEIADVKIVVKSDIQEKLRARQRANGPKLLPPAKTNNEPEHIRRAREREERRLRAEREKEYRSALLVQAAFLGWYARVTFLRMLEANIERLEQIRREEAYLKKRDKAILTIQSTFRMFVRRKRYLYVRDCKRRRERNEKEMKKIEKTIKGMPKQTKADIKELKKQHEEKKKAYKKSIRKRMKEEDDKMEEIKKSGQDMIKYWENQNKLVEQQKSAIANEQKVLEKQFEVLTAKSEEIHKNFQSLQAWVDKKNVAIKKHEDADQKCRFSYLPRYREDIAERNKYCMVEFRIKERYRKVLKKAIKEVEKRSRDAGLVKHLKKEMKVCQKEIAAVPEVPVPDGLERWLK